MSESYAVHAKQIFLFLGGVKLIADIHVIL